MMKKKPLIHTRTHEEGRKERASERASANSTRPVFKHVYYKWKPSTHNQSFFSQTNRMHITPYIYLFIQHYVHGAQSFCSTQQRTTRARFHLYSELDRFPCRVKSEELERVTLWVVFFSVPSISFSHSSSLFFSSSLAYICT